MEARFHLSNNVYECLEWIWRMSERSRVDVENEQMEWMWIIPEYLGRERF